jgi:hypothetical protein
VTAAATMRRVRPGTLRAAALLGLAGILAACARPATHAADRFERLGDGRFRYVVTATMLHPFNSEQAEHERLVELERRVKASRMCPSGYEVRRTPIFGYGRINQDDYAVGDLTYDGECRR